MMGGSDFFHLSSDEIRLSITATYPFLSAAAQPYSLV